MRTKYIIGIVVIMILLCIVVIVFYSAKSEPPEGYAARDDIVLKEFEKPRRTSGDEDGCIGPAGFEWCPSQNRCMRTWEEYCEEFGENYQGAEGDTGENPPEESENWPLYYSGVYEFYFQYPPEYHVVEEEGDDQSHVIVHVTHDRDNQVYDLTMEVWEQEEKMEIEERIEEDLPYFAIIEHPQTNKLISFTCWNSDKDCEDIYRTIGFAQQKR